MDQAGRDIAASFRRHLPVARQAALLVGGGNNGGDALTAGAILARGGMPVAVYLGTSQRSALVEARLQALLALPGTRLAPWHERPGPDCGLIDGLLGTGLSAPLRSDMRAYLEQAAVWQLPTIACDLPSGLDADSGVALGRLPKATATVALGAVKPGLLLADGPGLAGAVELCDLGMTPEELGVHRWWLTVDEVPAPAFGEREHKGQRGRVLVLAGSPGMAGAGALATLGALRAAAGLVRLAVDQALEPRYTAICPEATTLALAPDLAAATGALGQAVSEGFGVVAAGPGLGRGERAKELLSALFSSPWQKLVLDADALWHLAHGLSWPTRPKSVVLTPHQGEFEALFPDLSDTPVVAAETASRRAGATILLKGPTTIVSDGSHTTLLTGASDVLAQGGSGDVLSGLLAAILARTEDPRQAAVQAAAIHGRASRLLLAERGHGAGARALAELIPQAMARPA